MESNTPGDGRRTEWSNQNRSHPHSSSKSTIPTMELEDPIRWNPTRLGKAAVPNGWTTNVPTRIFPAKALSPQWSQRFQHDGNQHAWGRPPYSILAVLCREVESMDTCNDMTTKKQDNSLLTLALAKDRSMRLTNFNMMRCSSMLILCFPLCFVVARPVLWDFTANLSI